MIADDCKLPWLDAFGIVVATIPYAYQEIRRKPYKDNPNVLAGCCYAASEAIYHLSSDPLEAWWLKWGPEAHKTHWFLKHGETGQIIDPTASQFPRSNLYGAVMHWNGSDEVIEPNIYAAAKRRAFMTKGPSKRAMAILSKIDFTNCFR